LSDAGRRVGPEQSVVKKSGSNCLKLLVVKAMGDVLVKV
jgi:hypothetical protein